MLTSPWGVLGVGAGSGFVLSLLSGAIGGNPFGVMLVRSILAAGLLGGFAYGAQYVLRRYVPDFFQPAADDSPGREVDIVLPEENPHVDGDVVAVQEIGVEGPPDVDDTDVPSGAGVPEDVAKELVPAAPAAERDVEAVPHIGEFEDTEELPGDDAKSLASTIEPPMGGADEGPDDLDSPDPERQRSIESLGGVTANSKGLANAVRTMMNRD